MVNAHLKLDRFVGVKLHPLFHACLPNSEIVHPIAKAAINCNKTIQFHCDHSLFSLPWSYESHQKISRLENCTCTHGPQPHSIHKRNQNIYLETSAMPMHTKIKGAVETVGREKVMYGSDMPCGHPAWELEIRISGLKKEDLERVLQTNTEKLYKI